MISSETYDTIKYFVMNKYKRNKLNEPNEADIQYIIENGPSSGTYPNFDRYYAKVNVTINNKENVTIFLEIDDGGCYEIKEEIYIKRTNATTDKRSNFVSTVKAEPNTLPADTKRCETLMNGLFTTKEYLAIQENFKNEKNFLRRKENGNWRITCNDNSGNEICYQKNGTDKDGNFIIEKIETIGITTKVINRYVMIERENGKINIVECELEIGTNGDDINNCDTNGDSTGDGR